MAHHLDQHGRVDVPAGEERDCRPFAPHLAREERGDADRSGALDHELGALEQHDDRVADLLAGNLDDVREQIPAQVHGQLRRTLYGDPIGEREARRLGLHADDAHLRPHLAQGERDSRGEPAAADRDDHRLDLRQLLGELEPDRALTGDHLFVEVGVDERRARPLDVLARGRQRFLEPLAAHLDAGAVAPGRVDLGHRRVLGNEDRRRDARLARRPGDGLPVVAGACRDDARGTLGVGEAPDLVDRAADFEGAGALKVLVLQVHVAAGQARERLRAVDGRDSGDVLEPMPRRLDLTKCGNRPRLQS